MPVATVLYTVAIGLLYLYRLSVVVHCMRRPPDDFAAATDRIIWVGLAMFIPLGLGAVLYDVVLRGRVPLHFILPFAMMAICVVWIAGPFLLPGTFFNFDPSRR